MNEVLLVLLSLSVSGSILALLLFALRPLVKNRLSQTWQYYIWLVVILRFLLPFSPEVSIVGEAARHIENSIVAPIVTALVNEPETNREEQPFAAAPQEEAETAIRSGWRTIVDNIWMLWFIVALSVFTYRIIVYNNFTRYVRGRAQVTTDARLLDIYRTERTAAKVRRKVPLRVSDRVGTPMLIGIFRPILVLPFLDAGDDELRHIFRHELIHYKRLDYLYKWIVQFTICLHWFNPLVYRIGKHIDKSCELSCDEAVIRNLDSEGRITYGNALMASLKSQEHYSRFVISMTMSDNVKSLKERLDMIMSYKKTTRLAVVCTVVLTVAMLLGAGAMGAYAAANNQIDDKSNVDTNNLRIISVDIDRLEGLTSVEVEGEIVLSVGDTIYYDISSDGYSALTIGFVKADDTYKTAERTYFQVGNTNYIDGKVGIQSPQNPHFTVTANEEGNYKFFVCNANRQVLQNINGTVQLSTSTDKPANTAVKQAPEGSVLFFSDILDKTYSGTTHSDFFFTLEKDTNIDISLQAAAQSGKFRLSIHPTGSSKNIFDTSYTVSDNVDEIFTIRLTAGEYTGRFETKAVKNGTYYLLGYEAESNAIMPALPQMTSDADMHTLP